MLPTPIPQPAVTPGQTDWQSERLIALARVAARHPDQQPGRTVSKGGNLLLNVDPTARGEFDDRALATLCEIGAWTRRHGRAIYGATLSEHALPPSWP